MLVDALHELYIKIRLQLVHVLYILVYHTHTLEEQKLGKKFSNPSNLTNFTDNVTAYCHTVIAIKKILTYFLK